MSTLQQNWDFYITWQPQHLWRKREILIHYRIEEKWLYWRSSSNMSGCTKALCSLQSCMKILHLAIDLFLGLHYFFITCNIASNSTDVLVLFTSLQNIVTLSITVIICVSVKSTMSYNGTYDFCIFEIFLKNRFCGHSSCVRQTIKILIDLVWTDSIKTKLHVVFKPTNVHSKTS